MVLSSVQNYDVLLFIHRRDVIAAEDIDDLILEINKNKDKVKSLLVAKNRLTRDIDNTMRQRAKKGEMFCEAQMIDYREFSEFYEAESAILTSYMARLKQKMGQTARSIIKPHTDLVTLHKRLEAIVTLQKRAIAVLTDIVNVASQTLNTLAL